ncbi:MAG: dethiobiotin synthase [Corynebacterium sp.]|uniref:dethiobiotin synthase n=1 Tax=Corynebacterium sp. TaxID=1720 RepID=UPI0026491AE7|nr:dethiobiotin synthase [Corynebacterium sp.]MDN5723647.1 dethiobiotin synthase [Corynebacterium sp.]
MIVLVTGTGTDVGKTVATAALAACGESRGHDVALVKPVQTGESPGSGDLATITALTGIADTHCFATCPEPLVPVTAAQRAGVSLPSLEESVRRVRDLDGPGRLVLVEGAGGVLVQLGDYTIADLAQALQAPVAVVTTTGLGSLNHLISRRPARWTSCAPGSSAVRGWGRFRPVPERRRVWPRSALRRWGGWTVAVAFSRRNVKYTVHSDV